MELSPRGDTPPSTGTIAWAADRPPARDRDRESDEGRAGLVSPLLGAAAAVAEGSAGLAPTSTGKEQGSVTDFTVRAAGIVLRRHRVYGLDEFWQGGEGNAHWGY